MKQLSSNDLLNLSPIDSRYKNYTSTLSNYFSEYAYIKYRIEVEIKYLLALSVVGVIRKLKINEKKLLSKIIDDFDIKEAKKVKKLEKKTNHDVKAIEYYLKDYLLATSLSDTTEFVHFGLTSEDTNNIAHRLMLKDSINDVVLPSIYRLNSELLSLSNKYKNIPMLARTHGQAAVPTTLGKEFTVFANRLKKEIKLLELTRFSAKLNGAVGNYNALNFAYPKIKWTKFSKTFILSFDLKPNPTTNQIAPSEDIIYFFQTIQRINGIILDLDQDIWRYISDGWFVQYKKQSEVGSSTMPQKINPILFENSEGNIIIANSLISGLTDKLPLSRLQRDLSGSTISRNFGVTLAHCLISYTNTLEGLKKIKPNLEKIDKDLNEDWSILMEAVQIFLKKNGVKNGYEIVKNLSRGRKMSQNDYLNLIENLPLNPSQKKDLNTLRPDNYIGIH